MASAPLLSGTIEADDDQQSVKRAETLVPGTTASGRPGAVEEGGIVRRASKKANTEAGILRQSSHPLVLAMLYLFRSSAIAVYVLCGICELHPRRI